MGLICIDWVVVSPDRSGGGGDVRRRRRQAWISISRPAVICFSSSANCPGFLLSETRHLRFVNLLWCISSTSRSPSIAKDYLALRLLPGHFRCSVRLSWLLSEFDLTISQSDIYMYCSVLLSALPFETNWDYILMNRRLVSLAYVSVFLQKYYLLIDGTIRELICTLLFMD